MPLPVPAGVYGLLILFLCLTFGLVKIHQVKDAGDFLLDIMPLTFVPAGAKIFTLFSELKPLLIPIAVAAVFSTAVVMAATGHSAQWLIRKRNRKDSVLHGNQEVL